MTHSIQQSSTSDTYHIMDSPSTSQHARRKTNDKCTHICGVLISLAGTTILTWGIASANCMRCNIEWKNDYVVESCVMIPLGLLLTAVGQGYLNL